MFGLSVFPFRPPSSDLSKMSWKQNKDQISWMPVPFLLPSFPSAREVPGVVASPLGQHSRPTAREAEPGPLSSSFPCLAHLCSWGTIYIRSTFASHFLKQTAEQGRGERRTRRCPRGQKELELGVWDLRGGVLALTLPASHIPWGWGPSGLHPSRDSFCSPDARVTRSTPPCPCKRHL